MTVLKTRYEILLYATLFVLGLFAFALVRVPSDRLAQIAVAHAAAAGVDIEYDELASTLLPGFELRGVRIFDHDERSKPVVELAVLGLRTALLPLFTGKAGADVNAEGFGAHAKLGLRTRGSQAWVVGKIEGLELGQLPGVQDKLKVPLKGTADLALDLELAGTLMQSVGNIDVTLNDVTLEQGMLLGLAKFPGAGLGDIHGTLLFENGKLVFDRFAGDGQDVQLNVEGDVALREPPSASALNLNLKMKISPRMEQSIGFAFPLLALTKTPQGEYVRRVGGTLGAPR
jgi:type II secretion system protein N